jgi:signal transduction histidine kinase
MTANQSDCWEILHAHQEAIAGRWYEAIAPLIPALDVAEVRTRLAEWTQQAIDLLAEPLEREKAQAIGEALAHNISPEAPILGNTQQTLAQQFVEGLSAEQSAALHPILAGFLGELATGFVRENAKHVRAMRRQFLSITSHDMRAPLNAIMGFSRVILKGIDGPLTEFQEQDLTAVYEGGQKLLGFINDVFNIERIEVDVLDVEAKDFDLAGLVGAATTEVQAVFDENGDKLEIHYMNAPAGMHSDPTKVKQVLVNLLSHAARFTRQGAVTLTVTHEAVAGADWIVFRVADTGLGLTPEQVQRFTQAGDVRALQYGDIGLTVSQRYCRLLGGDVAVQSEVGKGTTFTVRLPVKSLAASQ